VVELAVVAVVVVGLVALALLPATWALWGGAVVTLGSLLVGTLAGIGYHVMLARALGGLPSRWWWNPTPHHDDLSDEHRGRVMRWFHTGAAGFLGCMLGLAMAITGLAKSLL
jgi:hypothetical protein